MLQTSPPPTPSQDFADPVHAHLPVDSHFHLFSAGQAQPGARYRPDYSATWADWQSKAQAVGVGRGVLVQTSFLGTDNRQLLAQLALHPGALRGIAVVAPDTDLEALQALHQQGVRGIRLNLAGLSHDITIWCQSAHALWPSLAHLGWHLELHTDQAALPTVLRQLPTEVPLVLDHFAKPGMAKTTDDTVRAVLARHRSQPVHIKLSGAYRLGGVHPQALAQLWLAELGAGALLWGSDWPCTNHEALAHYGDLHAALHGWVGEDAAALKAILADNPQRLYA